jgi:Tol biopolymer transport system component
VTARVLLVSLVLALSTAHLAAATRYDPRLRFRTLSTAHFDIHFHQGEEPLAKRLERIAEEVADRLELRLGRPGGRVHVILVAQTDVSNGWATPVPYDLIEIVTVAPGGASAIGNTDDWLRLVFSHEYTHIVHLDRSRGVFGRLRRVFGHLAPLYPNLFLPEWQVEGLATFEESELTGRGRVRAGDFRMILDEAAVTRRFDPIDRASGGLVDWPGGNAAYLYGAYFHQYLADRFGPESLARLERQTSGRVPYFGSGAFPTVFGRSLGTLWREFESDSRQHAAVENGSRVPLTRDGFAVASPRFSADGRLFYAVSNPHGFPALMELLAGSTPRQVTTKYGGARIATAGSTLVFDQLEVVRNVALQSDLYAVPEDGGRVRRLTRDARAAEPDVAADGRRIVCTVQSADRRDLATLDMPADGRTSVPVTLISEPFTQFDSPRWSRDGRLVAAVRQRLGGPSEIVVVDSATRDVRVLVSSAPARNIAPVWLPDGKHLLFASNRDGRPFTIYAVDADTLALRRLAASGDGAQSPDLSPDGRTLVFVGYSADGYDLYSLPFDTASWVDVTGNPAAPSPPVLAEISADAASSTGPYKPWSTLAPRFWIPIANSSNGEGTAGAATGGSDALGRHIYNVYVEWAATRARPDWQVAYAYDRWWPTLFANVSDDTNPWRKGVVRTREANAGALLPFVRVRRVQTALLALHASSDLFDCSACAPAVAGVARRRAVRAGWRYDSAKTYGYSISDEEGRSLLVTSEWTRRALGSSGDAGAFTVDARAYLRTFRRHDVIAARAALASAWGDDSVRRVFSASGAGPQTGAFEFGRDAIGLLRGLNEGALAGARAAVVNVDYRVKLASIQRGFRTWPFFVRTIHGAVFADAGSAWETAFHLSEAKKAVGAELSMDAVVGHALPLTFTAGVAWRDDPVTRGRSVAAFGRIGRAF